MGNALILELPLARCIQETHAQISHLIHVFAILRRLAKFLLLFSALNAHEILITYELASGRRFDLIILPLSKLFLKNDFVTGTKYNLKSQREAKPVGFKCVPC